MLLRKEQGGTGIGDYFWDKDGDVVEVPDSLGYELLAIKGGGFTEVPPHEAKHESNVDWRPVETEDGSVLEDGEESGPAVDLDGDGVPDGTANQIMDWVGEDPARAAAALAAEEAKGDAARSSLITKLARLTE